MINFDFYTPTRVLQTGKTRLANRLPHLVGIKL